MTNMGNNWQTPDHIFQPLNDIFNFDCDVAASAENAKCLKFIVEEMDVTRTKWGVMNWCNPPYGRGLFEPFVNKAIEEARLWGNRTVMLHKCDPSTKAFQKTWGYWHYFYNFRVRFVGAPGAANFPVCLTLFGDYSTEELKALVDLGQGRLVK